jgi:hypothetical protein
VSDKELPGHLIRDPEEIIKISIPDGKVALLYSRYGVEGVFSNGLIMQAFLIHLCNLAAYRDEPVSVIVHEIDPIL